MSCSTNSSKETVEEHGGNSVQSQNTSAVQRSPADLKKYLANEFVAKSENLEWYLNIKFTKLPEQQRAEILEDPKKINQFVLERMVDLIANHPKTIWENLDENAILMTAMNYIDTENVKIETIRNLGKFVNNSEQVQEYLVNQMRNNHRSKIREGSAIELLKLRRTDCSNFKEAQDYLLSQGKVDEWLDSLNFTSVLNNPWVVEKANALVEQLAEESVNDPEKFIAASKLLSGNGGWITWHLNLSDNAIKNMLAAMNKFKFMPEEKKWFVSVAVRKNPDLMCDYALSQIHKETNRDLWSSYMYALQNNSDPNRKERIIAQCRLFWNNPNNDIESRAVSCIVAATQGLNDDEFTYEVIRLHHKLAEQGKNYRDFIFAMHKLKNPKFIFFLKEKAKNCPKEWLVNPYEACLEKMFRKDIN